MLTSDAEGEQANALLREAAPDAVVFAPSMAAPPSYAAARARGARRADRRSGTGRRSSACRHGLTQAQATVNSSQVAAVMLANALVRGAAAVRDRDRRAGRPGRRGAAAPHGPGGSRRVVPARRVRAAGRRGVSRLPRRRGGLDRPRPSRGHRAGGDGGGAERGLRGRRRGADRPRPRRARRARLDASRGRGRRAEHAARARARGPGARRRTPSRRRSTATPTCCAGTPRSGSPAASARRS